MVKYPGNISENMANHLDEAEGAARARMDLIYTVGLMDMARRSERDLMIRQADSHRGVVHIEWESQQTILKTQMMLAYVRTRHRECAIEARNTLALEELLHRTLLGARIIMAIETETRRQQADLRRMEKHRVYHNEQWNRKRRLIRREEEMARGRLRETGRALRQQATKQATQRKQLYKDYRKGWATIANRAINTRTRITAREMTSCAAFQRTGIAQHYILLVNMTDQEARESRDRSRIVAAESSAWEAREAYAKSQRDMQTAWARREDRKRPRLELQEPRKKTKQERWQEHMERKTDAVTLVADQKQKRQTYRQQPEEGRGETTQGQGPQKRRREDTGIG